MIDGETLEQEVQRQGGISYTQIKQMLDQKESHLTVVQPHSLSYFLFTIPRFCSAWFGTVMSKTAADYFLHRISLNLFTPKGTKGFRITYTEKVEKGQLCGESPC